MTSRSLVDPDYYIGTVTYVGPAAIQANFPHATARPERRRLSRGAVGDFVFIDCEHVKLLGRVVEVRIPDAERLSLEPSLGSPPDPHPIGFGPPDCINLGTAGWFGRARSDEASIARDGPSELLMHTWIGADDLLVLYS